MATQPEPQPDTIEPQSPDESPSDPGPIESPPQQPDEVGPTSPDVTEPGKGPDEV